MFGLRALGALPYTGRPETAVSGAIKHYLDINPSNKNGNQYVTIPSITVTGDFTIEIDCEIYNTTLTDSDGFVFSGGNSGGGFELYRDSNTQNYRPSLWLSNAKNFNAPSDIWPYASSSTANPRRITIQRIGGVVSSNFAGTAGTNVSIASENNIVISAFGARPNGTYTLGLRLYRLRIYQGSTLVRDYNAANTSSGVTLVDEVSGQNGTIQNPPTGNTQWVPYLDTTVSNALVPQPVSGAIKCYLKWPATTGTNNKALVQLSGIGTSSYLTLVFAEDVIDPSSISYIYDGRRALDTVTEGNGGYFLEMSNAVQVNGVSNITLNGVASNNTAWRTAKVGDAYKFFFDAGLDGVISVGGRFNEIEGFPLLALRTIIVDDANGSHVIDLTNKAGLTQFTSNDGLITAKLFGFNIGACWMPYLDTTVSTPIVSQGVNGVANYFCALNGTSYFTAPSLGDLLTGSPKIRINIKKFKQFGSSVEPIFWQGGNSWGTREFALRNNSSLGNIIIGGVATGFTWSNLTSAFGDPNLTCDEFGSEINGSNAIFYKNKVAVFTVPNLSKGTSRLDGALLFIGAQAANDTAGSTAAISIVPNGMQYGNIEILINDVLVRNYKMPDNGSTVIDTVASNNLTQRGTFTIDNNEWRQYIVSSSPSGQASSTLNIPFKKFDVAASFQNIKPTSSTALDMAFKKFVVNSSLQSLPPQSQTTVAMTFNQFAVLVSGETTKPVFNSTANINFKKFGILVDGSSGKPTSSITISSTFKKFNAAITGQSVKPTSSVDASITFKKFAISSSGESVRPQTTATVTTVFKKFSVASSLEFTKPVFNSTVAATFKSFNVAASIDSDVPLFNTSISITMPAFGVSVIMGDVKFFGSDGTHYEHEALSTASQYEAGSTVDYAPYFSTHTEWRL